jgi:hypothetical protein
MDGVLFFRRQADQCREAAAQADPAESRALMQMAKHYEKEARTAGSAPPTQASQRAELPRH